jgi:hypothetical protein
MTSPALLTTDLLAKGWHWHSGLTCRVAEELSRLAALPYFEVERHFFKEDRAFAVIGVLAHKSIHGRTDRFRVRLEYPDNYPDAVPAVYDHDQVFQPLADGHLFSDWMVCLTFPDRGEFELGLDNLSEQVLGASLIWFHKRSIFERGDRKDWPGPAELHGMRPRIVLILERTGLFRNAFFMEWVCWLLRSRLAPNLAGLCPCNSGKGLSGCHAAAAQQIYAAVIGG